jgi:hypothetical protein
MKPPKTSPKQQDPIVLQLTTCLQILQNFGPIGERIWKLGKWYVGDYQDGSEPQFRKRKEDLIWSQQQRLDYYLDAIKHLRKKLKEKIGYRELPVDFRTFCESPEYLNKPGILWPKVIEHGVRINSGDYVEAVLTGAIGVAKTTLAIYTIAYQQYVLACMEEPHETFDLDPSSEILMVLQSLNKNVAQDVDYKRLRDMVSNSPWFEENFPYQKDRETDMRFPRNMIIKPISGQDTAAIGQNVIGGIIDEINFMAVVEKSKQSKNGETYDQATQNYESIATRRNSRFAQLGALPGMLCLVSSRNYPGQFTDKKEAEAKTNKTIYIYDRRIWELRPERFGFYRGTRTEALEERWGKNYPFWFHVFVGDSTRKPRLVDSPLEFKEEDRHLVHAVPIEFKAAFVEKDLLTQLRDVVGVATQAMHPFMLNTDAIAACFGLVRSVLSRDKGDFVTSQIAMYPKHFMHKEEPRFAHLDLSDTKDSTGVACGFVPKFVEVDRGDVKEILPVIQFDFILEVLPPKGGEIDYGRIRRMLYMVNKHVKLKWVSADTHQSKDMLQILAGQGFTTGTQSMDTDNLAYDMLKQAIYDGRVVCPPQIKAIKEASQLELVPSSGVIDHPPNGSKDLTDAMAGVVYGLTMRREIWVKHGVSIRQIPKTLEEQQRTAHKKSITYVEKLRQDRFKEGVDTRWTEGSPIGTVPMVQRPNLRTY